VSKQLKFSGWYRGRRLMLMQRKAPAGQSVPGDWSSRRPLLISAPCIVKSSAKSHVTHTLRAETSALRNDRPTDSHPPVTTMLMRTDCGSKISTIRHRATAVVQASDKSLNYMGFKKPHFFTNFLGKCTGHVHFSVKWNVKIRTI